MSVLVTGGAGYIGSHMVWELLDNGIEPVVVDNLATGFEWAVAPQAKFIRGDIGDQPLMEQVIGDHRIEILPQQYLQFPQSHCGSCCHGCEALHLLLHCGCLRRADNNRSNQRERNSQSDVALWVFQADDGNHAARRSKCA